MEAVKPRCGRGVLVVLLALFWFLIVAASEQKRNLNSEDYVEAVTCGTLGPQNSGLCAGYPVRCVVVLSDVCSGLNFSSAVVIAQVAVEGGSRCVTDFHTVSQRDLELTFTLSYNPDPANIYIELTAPSFPACSFKATDHFDVTECPHELSINAEWDPATPYAVQGGDALSMHLHTTAIVNPPPIFMLAVRLHPALTLISSNTSMDGGRTMIDFAGILQCMEPLIFIDSFNSSNNFSAYLTVQVQPYVLPEANLYVSLYIVYQSLNISEYPLVTMTKLTNVSTLRPTVAEPMIDLPSYKNDTDSVTNTLPPHTNDLFNIYFPLILPRVSTNLDLSVQLFNDPSFSVIFTGGEVYFPPGLLYLQRLCDYMTPGSQPELCQETGMSPPAFDIILGPPDSPFGSGSGYVPLDHYFHTSGSGGSGMDIELTGSGDIDERTALIRLPTLLYRNENQYDAGSQTVLVQLHGKVSLGFSNSTCGMPALSNYIRAYLFYSREVKANYLSGTEVASEEMHFRVFAGVPYLGLELDSSTNGIESDVFTVIFTIIHNPSVSNLIPYNISYSLHVDSRLSLLSNGTLCLLSSGAQYECSDAVFDENMISGSFDRIAFARVEVNVSTNLEGSPGTQEFTNIGSISFQSLPTTSQLDLTPISCKIPVTYSFVVGPVELSWVVDRTSVAATQGRFITIGEQIILQLQACFPPSQTGVYLVISLPTDSTNGTVAPLVSIRKTVVTSVGMAIQNTTLITGNDERESEDIIISDDHTSILFFFGSMVTITENTGNEQCLDVAIDIVVNDNPYLVDGEMMKFTAVVETDFMTTTTPKIIAFEVAEPSLVLETDISTKLPIAPGQTITLTFALNHAPDSNTSAFQVSLTLRFPPKLFAARASGVASFGSIAIVRAPESGAFLFSADELSSSNNWTVSVELLAMQSVDSGAEYVLLYNLVWNSLPQMSDEGRTFSTAGNQSVSIRNNVNATAAVVMDSSLQGISSNVLHTNEVFQLSITAAIPQGMTQLQYILVITTTLGRSLPITVLFANQSVPDTITTNSSQQTILSPSSNSTQITWDFGLVDNAINSTDDEIGLQIIAVVAEDAPSLLPLQFSLFAQADGIPTTPAVFDFLIADPEVVIVDNIKVHESTNNQSPMIVFTVIILNLPTSLAAAFNVMSVISIPKDIGILSTQVIPPHARVTRERRQESDTVTTVHEDVLLPGENITVTYTALIDSSFPDATQLYLSASLLYSNTPQQGALQTTFTFNGSSFASQGNVCIIKRTVDSESKERYSVLGVAVGCVAGVISGMGVAILALFIFCVCKVRSQQSGKWVIPHDQPMLQFHQRKYNSDYEFNTIHLDRENLLREKCDLFQKNDRSLTSSLLTVMDVENSHERKNIYEINESEYIGKAENGLLLVEEKIVCQLTEQFICEKGELTEDNLIEVKEQFQSWSRQLREATEEALTIILKQMETSNRTIKRERAHTLSQSQSQTVERISAWFETDQRWTSQLISTVEQQDVKEKEELLTTLKLEEKAMEQFHSQKCLTTYLLKLKAAATAALKKSSPISEALVTEFQGRVAMINRCLLEEHHHLEETTLKRNERQRILLQEKKLVDEENQHWQSLVTEQFKDITQLLLQVSELTGEEAEGFGARCHSDILWKLRELESGKSQNEEVVLARARAALKSFELELTSDTNRDEDSDLLMSWQTQQALREEALRRVEENAATELVKLWTQLQKDRMLLLEEEYSSMRERLMSKGVVMKQCDEVLTRHGKERIMLCNRLQSTSMIQKAKLEALFNRKKHKLSSEDSEDERLLAAKKDLERRALCEREVIEQFSDQELSEIEKSLATDLLRISVKLKRKLAHKREKKYNELEKEYFQKRQEESRLNVIKEAELLQWFVEERAQVLVEMTTKYTEEERRKVEEEAQQEAEAGSITGFQDQTAALASEIESWKHSSDCDSGHLEDFAKMEMELEAQCIKQSLQGVDGNVTALVLEYRQNQHMIRQNSKEEKEKTIKDLQERLQQKRQQKEQELKSPCSTLTSSEGKPRAILRFKEAVLKQIHLTQLKRIEEEYDEEKRKALAEIHSKFETKLEDAIEELEKDFEQCLSGMDNVCEKDLVTAFNEIYSWHLASEKPVIQPGE